MLDYSKYIATYKITNLQNYLTNVCLQMIAHNIATKGTNQC